MADPSHAQTALGARAASDPGSAGLSIDLSELPGDVLARLEERARAPDRRLTVGRYVIVGELGRGGMGVVYEAWDPRIERRVAIKTIEPELVPEEDRDEVIERFRRETKVVGRLHHPGIVTIYDYGEDQGGAGGGLGTLIYYYVMEYLEGHSLARILRERRTMPDIEAVSIVAEIGEALQVSHAAGIIHRDIKPSNIFLKNDREAVLLDFGIAKTASVALTRQGQILGTPSYLAPERLREKEVAVDGRADIFSLGVLLFTMLTGEAPFVGADVYDVIDKIAKVSHPKLARTTPSGQALSRVIDRMLAKRPDDRYPSAGEAAQALRGVLGLLKNTNPEIGDLVSGAVRIREPLPDALATEIATPSSALAPVKDFIGVETSGVTEAASGRGSDEEDTGRQPIGRGVAARGLDPHARPEVRAESRQEGRDPIERATELASSETRARVADLLGTRPDLALQRETREITRGPEVRSLPPPLPSVTIFDSKRPGGGREALGDTAPARAADDNRGSEAEDTYDPHAPSNDETTDDHTIAAGGGAAAGANGQAAGRARGTPPRAGSTKNAAAPGAHARPSPAAKGGAQPSPASAKSPSGPTPSPPSSKSPSGPTPSPPSAKSGSAPAFSGAPAASGKSASQRAGSAAGPAKSPARSGSAGAKSAPPPLPAPSGSTRSKEERIQTEPVIRASNPEHSEAKTENDRGAGPTVRPAQAKRKRTSRIEASLVDEDDVVVKPAPLDTLKPDELPTQTGFRLPGGGSLSGSQSTLSPLPSSQTVNEDVVRVRGDIRVPDPAEPSRAGAESAAEGADARANGGTDGAIDLSETSGPLPELDLPRSAAVARRTFGAARSQPAGRSARAAAPAAVQVRVSGSALLSADRLRIVRRRGFMLFAAMLAAIAVGLFLGRMKQRSIAISVDLPSEPAKQNAVEPPRALKVSAEGTGAEPELVRPRTAAELVQDATAAFAEGRLAKAERLFESAARAAPERTPLRAQAMLGRADALQKLGGKDAAIQLYRGVLSETPKSKEADEAKAALASLGVTLEPPKERPTPRPGAAGQGAPKRSEMKDTSDAAASGVGPRSGGGVASSGEGKTTPVPVAITPGMTPDEKCLALAAKHINDPKEAVRAFTQLTKDEPKSSCVYWHLGNSYAKLHDDRAALASYRRYLELRPDAQNRPAVDARIKNLAAKVEER